MLSSFDDKIELLREQNKTLEATAQAIFKEWFVNFQAPGVKLRKATDEEKILTGKNQFPDGWRVGKLGEEFEIMMGQSPMGESYNETCNGMIFFQGRADFSERFPGLRLYTTEPKRIAEKLDVLLSVRAPVGDINVAFERCCIGRGLAAIRSRNKSYTLHKIKSLRAIFMRFEAEGTVFGSLGKNDFADIEVIVPPEAVIAQFETLTSSLDQKYFKNCQQIQTLSTLRDTLLPKLMQGKVRVKGF